MAAKRRIGCLSLVLLVGLAIVPAADAGPYIGEWGWCWNPDHGCPGTYYHWLHYWAPNVYRVRYWCHPSYLDQYPPGPYPAPPAPVAILPSPCRGQPPVPSPPYGSPQEYYGRSIASGVLKTPPP
jgi:hypothetical protein